MEGGENKVMTKFISYRSHKGSFNLCNQKDISTQYIFDFGKWNDEAKEKGIIRSFILGEDDCYTLSDTSSAELVAVAIDYYSSWWSSVKERLPILLTFIREHEAESNILYCEHMLETAKKSVSEWEQRLAKATEEETKNDGK